MRIVKLGDRKVANYIAIGSDAVGEGGELGARSARVQGWGVWVCKKNIGGSRGNKEMGKGAVSELT